MTQYFDTAVAFTLKAEDASGTGKVSYDEGGGATRWGIAQKYHPNVDVPNLSREAAIEIYRVEYWGSAAKCAVLPPAIGVAVFDCAVNPGVGDAITILQQSVGIDATGFVGRLTIRASWERNILETLQDIIAHREVCWSQKRFFHGNELGWFRRATRLYELCRQLVPATG